MAAPNDHVIIGDLPAELDDAGFKSNFEAYGTLKWYKLYPAGANGKKSALVELGSIDEAKWLVENLHGNVPLGLENEVTVKYKAAGGKAGAKGGAPPGGKGDARPGPYSGGAISPGLGGKGAAGMMGQGGGGKADAQWTQWGGYALSTAPSTVADLWKGLIRHKVLPGGTWCNDEKTVLINGLPQDTQDHDLLKIFSPFGAIAPGGVRVTLNDDGTAKGNGMINFLTLESAQQAVETLNNCMLPDGKFLRLKTFDGAWKGGKGKGKGNPSPGAAGPAVRVQSE